MCSGSMACDDGGGHCLRPTAAVILVLCSLAKSSTCFSFLGLSTNAEQDKMVSEAAVMEVRTGSILFNGKELDSQSGSASTAAARGNDLDQSDETGMLEQRSHVEGAQGDEAAWRRMNPSLHCGQKKMKLKLVGRGGADLQLDMGSAPPLPFIQLPETCSYSVRQNALGLILIVPYDGCNVMQEDGNHVLSVRWLQTPIKFTCPMLASSATPTQQTRELPVPHWPLSLTRQKRETKQPPSGYDPSTLYYNWLHDYCMYLARLAHAPGADTNAQPAVAISAPWPSTEKHPQMDPAYPSLYQDYYLQYYPHNQYLSYGPMQTTSPPATAKPTTGPATTASTPTASTTTAPTSTTTATVLTTNTGQKPQQPPYPYFYFPYYSAGQFQGVRDNSDLYQYQMNPYYYGMPNVPMQTPQPPTAEPVAPTTSAKPLAPTTPAVSNTTTKPATTSAPTTTTALRTEAPSVPAKPSGNSPGPMNPYVPYHQLPFAPYISLKERAAAPYDQGYMPQAGYNSRPQVRAPQPPNAGPQYWQPVPWFSPMKRARRFTA